MARASAPTPSSYATSRRTALSSAFPPASSAPDPPDVATTLSRPRKISHRWKPRRPLTHNNRPQSKIPPRANMNALRIIFWASAGLVVYAYAVYPVAIWCLSRLFGRPPQAENSADTDLPSVTLRSEEHTSELQSPMYL